MRGIIIIVEGQTEEEFVNNCLYDYFLSKGITDVRPIKIQTSPGHKGGLINYSSFNRDITNYLKREPDVIVTSLIDYFRLPSDFPKYEESKKIASHIDRVLFLEKTLSERINSNNFIPYMQLHEFEGLLFTKRNGFDLFTDLNESNKREIVAIIDGYPNPELINDGAETAPSKRLMRLIPGYEKPFHGPIIALENGLQSILEKCTRFKNWLESLVAKMKEK